MEKSEVVRKMLQNEKIEYLRSFFEMDAICPCCCETEVCAEDCTFKDDAPADFEKMENARKVLKATS